MSRTRLHIGCGPQALAGWTNVDNRPYPGVDRILDVTIGLPYSDVEYLFAEHLIEHLAYDDALNFLRECRRVLAPDGVLRLSTPNLDWVLRTQYLPELWKCDDDAVRDCFVLNRAFKGWGHQFLYNRQSLAATLRLAGFGVVEECGYGESRHEALRGIERHDTYGDEDTGPHVLIVEASGRSSGAEPSTEAQIAEFRLAIDSA